MPAQRAFVSLEGREGDAAFVRPVPVLQHVSSHAQTLPTVGAQDIGESVIDAVKREVAEETGIVVEVVHLTGIYSDPRHVIAYDNGEVRQEFSLCFRAKPVGGSLRMSAEATKVQWVSPERLDSLKIHPSMRLRIDHGLAAQCAPYIS